MRISDWSSDVCSSDLPRYRADNSRAFAVLIDGRDEAAINLDPIKGQGTQMRKRAITGAEIVKRDAYALILQRPDDGLGQAQILAQVAFGNLYFQPDRREARFNQHLQDFLTDQGTLELAWWAVDRQRMRRIPRS